MNIPLTAEIHQEGDWFVAFCPEVPEANGQGHTKEECLQSLRDAMLLLMEDRREDARKKSGTALLELVWNAATSSGISKQTAAVQARGRFAFHLLESAHGTARACAAPQRNPRFARKENLPHAGDSAAVACER